MLTRLQHLLALFALVGLVVMTACQQRQKVEEEGGAVQETTEVAPPAGADTGMVPETAVGAETAMGADTGMKMDTGTSGMSEERGGGEVSVTNPMPHPMVVKAEWGQGEKELGTVQPNATETFEISAPAGTQVTLKATDEKQSHSTSGSVTLASGSPATWTIQ